MANAFDRAAAREKELHPTNARGQTITAWDDRAKRLNHLWDSVAVLAASQLALQERVAALEAQQPPNPFP